jgi:two-component system, chemotaxis family, chemotaxis protein CheY
MMPDAPKKKPCRVLLIEDDQDDIFLFKRAVETAEDILGSRIELDCLGDGAAALEFARGNDPSRTRPDVVLLDLGLPGFDPMEFLRALRGDDRLKNLPVIVMTDSTVPAVHEKASKAGADRVLVKPTDTTELLRIALDTTSSHCPVPEAPAGTIR